VTEVKDLPALLYQGFNITFINSQTSNNFPTFNTIVSMKSSEGQAGQVKVEEGEFAGRNLKISLIIIPII
jgi:hypothetical protein